MSKIYKALEKAEKERERVGHPPSSPKEQEERREESREFMPGVSKIKPWVSDQSLVSLSQPGSLAAEQFRKLRTYLLREKSLDFPKTIMVTSATNDEGKTFVSANLAAGIVQDLHAHALMVDCDMRSPQLSQWFGLNEGKGLSDYLAGDGKLDGLLKKTGVEKLSILSGGGVRDNPTELIASKKMEALVDELKTRYRDRYIIFDSTPLLATTEPEVLAKLVDGIIIVIKAGVTPRETVKQAIASLDKEKIIGFVLNGLEFKSSGLSSRYFGSNGYYYKYGYGYGKGKSNGESRWKKIFPFARKGGG